MKRLCIGAIAMHEVFCVRFSATRLHAEQSAQHQHGHNTHQYNSIRHAYLPGVVTHKRLYHVPIIQNDIKSVKFCIGTKWYDQQTVHLYWFSKKACKVTTFFLIIHYLIVKFLQNSAFLPNLHIFLLQCANRKSSANWQFSNLTIKISNSIIRFAKKAVILQRQKIK